MARIDMNENIVTQKFLTQKIWEHELRYLIPIVHIYSLSDLPECQVPIATRTDIIDQILAIALHPLCECRTAMVSVTVIVNLIESPKAHVSIIRKEVVEKMLQIHELQQRMVEEPSAQDPLEDLSEISVLKYVAITPPSHCPYFVHVHTYTYTQIIVTI